MTENSPFERVEFFRYLGKTLTDQNSIQEDIKSRLKFWECLLLFGAESFVFQVAIQNRVLRRIFETNRNEVKRKWRKLYNEDFNDL